MEYEKKVKEAVDLGFFDEEEDAQDCFGTYNNFNYNCEECPLEDLCLDECEENG